MQERIAALWRGATDWQDQLKNYRREQETGQKRLEARKGKLKNFQTEIRRVKQEWSIKGKERTQKWDTEQHQLGEEARDQVEGTEERLNKTPAKVASTLQRVCGDKADIERERWLT